MAESCSPVGSVLRDRGVDLGRPDVDAAGDVDDVFLAPLPVQKERHLGAAPPMVAQARRWAVRAAARLRLRMGMLAMGMCRSSKPSGRTRWRSGSRLYISDVRPGFARGDTSRPVARGGYGAPWRRSQKRKRVGSELRRRGITMSQGCSLW